MNIVEPQKFIQRKSNIDVYCVENKTSFIE